MINILKKGIEELSFYPDNNLPDDCYLKMVSTFGTKVLQEMFALTIFKEILKRESRFWGITEDRDGINCSIPKYQFLGKFIQITGTVSYLDFKDTVKKVI